MYKYCAIVSKIIHTVSVCINILSDHSAYYSQMRVERKTPLTLKNNNIVLYKRNIVSNKIKLKGKTNNYELAYIQLN